MFKLSLHVILKWHSTVQVNKNGIIKNIYIYFIMSKQKIRLTSLSGSSFFWDWYDGVIVAG